MQLTKQEQQAIFDAKAGASVNIAQLTMDAPVIPLKMTAGGPPLLLSDDPEYIRLPQAGAMRETLRPGIFRLYSYHVNAIKGQQTRITNVIENLGDKPMTVRLLRQAFPKPDNEYNLVGCEGLKQYWTSTPEEQGRIVAPGQSIAIDPKMENTLISYDDLSHGFYEIFIDQPARITTLQTTSDKSGPDANKQIHELQPIPAENNNADFSRSASTKSRHPTHTSWTLPMEPSKSSSPTASQTAGLRDGAAIWINRQSLQATTASCTT